MTSITRILLCAAAVLLVAAARPALAECQPFPKVALWGDYTHARVKAYVAGKLDGDWNTYVGHLQKRLKALKAVQARGGKLTLNYRGKRVVLTGGKLDAYVRAATARVDVAQCLAADADADSLQNFATAAGGVDTEPQTSKVAAEGLNLSVRSECRAGVATFKVTNEGSAWPKSGVIGIYRTSDLGPKRISKRRIRFTRGQTSTFRVKADAEEGGALALWVSPGWASRAFAEDAKISCG